MTKKYWIPNSDMYRKTFSDTTNKMVVYKENNIVEVNGFEDIQLVIQDIQKYELVKDKDIKSFFNTNFPDIKIEGVPIDLPVLKEKLKAIFLDLPDEFFEETDASQLIKKAVNFYFVKKETKFIILNVLNRSLEYKDFYHHPPTIQFYFQMLKTGYNLEEYYEIIREAQKAIQRSVMKELLFPMSNRKLNSKDLDLIYRVLNITGRFYLDLDEKMDNLTVEIDRKRRFTKYSAVALPEDYAQIEKETLKKVAEVKADVKERLEGINKAKNLIRDELQSRKGIISTKHLKTLFDIALEFFL